MIGAAGSAGAVSVRSSTRCRNAAWLPSHSVPSERSRRSGSTSTTPRHSTPASSRRRATVCSHAVSALPARTTTKAEAPSNSGPDQVVPGAAEVSPRTVVSAARSSPRAKPEPSTTRTPVPSATSTRRWSPRRSSTTMTSPPSVASSVAMPVASCAATSAAPTSTRTTSDVPARTARASSTTTRSCSRCDPAERPGRSSRRPPIWATTELPRCAAMSRRSIGRSPTTVRSSDTSRPIRRPSSSPRPPSIAIADRSDRVVEWGASMTRVPATTSGAPSVACCDCWVSPSISACSCARATGFASEPGRSSCSSWPRRSVTLSCNAFV